MNKAQLQIRHIPFDVLTLQTAARCSDYGSTDESADTMRTSLEDIVRSVTIEAGAVIVNFESYEDVDSALTLHAWNLFSSFCEPIPQYHTGEMICDVRVTDKAVGVSNYLTNNSGGGFHTDGTLLARVPDVCALLCLSPAERGGATLLVDGRLAYRQLESLDPRFTQLLSEQLPFDSRGQFGDELVKWQPVFSGKSPSIQIRYLRHFIEEGYQQLGLRVNDLTKYALDGLQRLLEDPGNHYAAQLRRGQMLIWDNRWFVHGRQSFQDGEAKRHLQRFYGIM